MSEQMMASDYVQRSAKRLSDRLDWVQRQVMDQIRDDEVPVDRSWLIEVHMAVHTSWLDVEEMRVDLRRLLAPKKTK